VPISFDANCALSLQIPANLMGPLEAPRAKKHKKEHLGEHLETGSSLKDSLIARRSIIAFFSAMRIFLTWWSSVFSHYILDGVFTRS
jgi:hypothetical protein